MKKNTTLSAAILLFLALTTVSASARDFEFSKKKLNFRLTRQSKDDDKGPISGGIVLVFGIGFPTYNFRDEEFMKDYPTLPNPSYSKGTGYKMGTQYSLEFGTQFMAFKKEEKFGIAVNVGWVNLGYSSYSRDIYVDGYYSSGYYSSGGFYYDTYHYTDFDFRLLKFGPQVTFGFGQMALDVSANIIPITVNLGTAPLGSGYSYIHYGFFTNYSASVRARYKIFTAGFDVLFGNTHYSDRNVSGTTSLSNVTPKVVFGFRF